MKVAGARGMVGGKPLDAAHDALPGAGFALLVGLVISS